MVTLATIKNALFKTFQGSQGKSLSVDTQGEGGAEDTGESYNPSGFIGIPQDGVAGVSVDVNGNNIIIAYHNYKLNIVLDKGESKIFSYDVDGVVKGEIVFEVQDFCKLLSNNSCYPARTAVSLNTRNMHRVW